MQPLQLLPLPLQSKADPYSLAKQIHSTFFTTAYNSISYGIAVIPKSGGFIVANVRALCCSDTATLY